MSAPKTLVEAARDALELIESDDDYCGECDRGRCTTGRNLDAALTAHQSRESALRECVEALRDGINALDTLLRAAPDAEVGALVALQVVGFKEKANNALSNLDQLED